MRNGRALIYIPILHTSHDMGSLAGSMKKRYVTKLGEKKWREHTRAIQEMWNGIERNLKSKKLPFKKVKIYQDGIPICGKEREIVLDLAARGSPNHRIIKWMMDQGATIMGTEDPKLLVSEYNQIRRIVQAKTHEDRERLIHGYERVAARLLRERDEQIRNRILTTLKRGEVGVLFIGLLHRVDELLPEEVQVSYLMHRLPFGRSLERKVAV